jgi:ABC-2 type transport system permease protein
MSTFVTLLKREFWENRGGFVWAPSLVAVLFTAMFLIGLVFAQAHIGDAQIMGLKISQLRIKMPDTVLPEVLNGFQIFHSTIGLLIQMILGIVLFFYFIASLFDERKDRSVLFWKSMPVSDLTTVLSKIAAAMLVAPLIALAVTIVFNMLLVLIFGAFLSFNGVNAWKLLLWQAAPLKVWLTLLAGIPVNAIWALPSIGWLMLVSSWARGKPFLWAVLTPVVAGVLLTMFDAMSSLRIPDTWYWSEVFWRGLASVSPWSFDVEGGFRYGINISRNTQAFELLSVQSLVAVLTSLKTWVGAAVGVAMIAGAVHLRRTRELTD